MTPSVTGASAGDTSPKGGGKGGWLIAAPTGGRGTAGG